MLRRPAFKNLRTARASARCPVLGKSRKAAFAARVPQCNNLVGYI
jgi:probable 2-oxoglutarate dehydrogenase E1 component DHKTD1